MLSYSPPRFRIAAVDAHHDPLLPFLRSIKKALEASDDSASSLSNLLKDCIRNFKNNDRYRNDVRFLKIWLLYMGVSDDFDSVFKEMLDSNVCTNNSSLYVWSASFFELKGRLHDALTIYQLGICRNTEPIEWLKKARTLFLSRISEIQNAASTQKVDDKESKNLEDNGINPWGTSTMDSLLKKIYPLIMKFDGYRSSTKPYTGKVALSTLKNSSRNKVLEIGGMKYHIKGCAGQGGFAQVYKANVDSDPDNVVALKIQKPAFPWEFYVYRLLDKRILDRERSSYGFAHRIHVYSDCSILICDYLANGTLQDVINSYVVIGKSMEEVLCIYYTIEMLHMVETLHGVGLIHGDFKPDNLLIRYARGDLTEDGFLSRSGPWCDQGLCLVDWGRGIDLHLFPDHTLFKGDCKTSGFRCIEMLEDKPWKFQASHLLNYTTNAMELIIYRLLSFRSLSPANSYWNIELWKTFFTKMLNQYPHDDDRSLLQDLKKSFQDYLSSNPQLIKKLKELLSKQRASLCSA
ncbi:Mitotic checkpoint serine/threonine-protein kinase BUB1 [Glycine soja]|uniref:Mitotic checkpoint serine/threonine-protein kinase BUB1 isoform D n=2 Tax=Glycine soja TaxID=3848 RepID=A0A445KFQ7_GLYSO|nr:Mitotic checkpoint serine/threonine-protein kinase BUB1 isoform D [Glycine soja]